MNVLVEGTNAYAEEKHAGGCKEGAVATGSQLEMAVAGVHSRRCRPWKKVTTAEIRVFLGLLIYMGVTNLTKQGRFHMTNNY